MCRTSTLVILSALWLVATVSVLAEDNPPTATFQDFQEFSKKMEGRWVAKIKLIHDWPGFEKKKGEITEGHSLRRIVADGHALEDIGLCAGSESRALFYWDAGLKTIKIVLVTNAGITYSGSLGRNGDQWICIFEGRMPDGQKMTGKNVCFFKKDGTQVLEGQTYLEGKPMDPLHDEYRKVSK
jgi:hypothetical protein